MTGVIDPSDVSSPTLSELALSCYVGDLESAGELVVRHAAARRGGYVCHCNVHVLTSALHDSRLRVALSQAALRFPDGAPVAWLLRRLGYAEARRIGGPDLMPLTIELGRAAGLRHFLIGSTEGNLDRLRHLFDDAYPETVVGAHSPPYADEPEVDQTVVDLVRRADPHVVWVGLGAPKQELWSARAAASLPGVTLIGVGAAFDFLAGEKRRAPAWMHRAGLEWLHRLASEPRRLTSRYVRSNTEFIVRTTAELARRRLEGREH